MKLKKPSMTGSISSSFSPRVTGFFADSRTWPPVSTVARTSPLNSGCALKKAASKRIPFELPTGVTLPLYCSDGERVVAVMSLPECSYASAYIIDTQQQALQWHHSGHEPIPRSTKYGASCASLDPAATHSSLLQESRTLSVAEHRVHPARALPGRSFGLDCQQPDLHYHHGSGALDHSGAGSVHGVPDVCQVSGRVAEVAATEPDSQQHCASGAGLPDAICRAGQQIGGGGCGLFIRHGAGPDLDDRSHAQWHLAGAHAPSPRAAGAGVLGRADLGATAAGHQPEHHVLRHFSVQRRGGSVAG